MWKWISLLAFLIWCGISWNWYTCGIKSACTKSAADITQEDKANYGPIAFNWKGNEPVLGNGWDDLKGKLSTLLANDRTLQITGKYYDDEVEGASVQLGLDRGSAIKSLLSDVTDPARISVTHDVLGKSPESTDVPFEAAGFDILKPDGSVFSSLSGNLGEILSKFKGFDIPLGFGYSSSAPVIDKSWPEFKTDLLTNLPKGHGIQLVGRYMNGESYDGEMANLGIARANEVKKLFDGAIDASRLSIDASSVTGTPLSDGNWQALLINVLDPKGNVVSKWGIPGLTAEKEAVTEIKSKSEKGDETASAQEEKGDSDETDKSSAEEGESESAKDKTKIVEMDDRVIIYFPFNSATKESNPTIDSYLKRVAQKLKDGGSVSLTGHTDYVGDHNTNWILGDQRAKSIRNILTAEGVKNTRINVYTKGETEPMATNKTEEGRRKNRRVELVLN